MADRRLDRIPQFDERSRAFAAVSGIEDKLLREDGEACIPVVRRR